MRRNSKVWRELGLLTVRGIGERERFVRSLGFILARIKMDKAFLFIFYTYIYFRIFICWKNVCSEIKINKLVLVNQLCFLLITSLFGNNLDYLCFHLLIPSEWTLLATCKPHKYLFIYILGQCLMWFECSHRFWPNSSFCLHWTLYFWASLIGI